MIQRRRAFQASYTGLCCSIKHTNTFCLYLDDFDCNEDDLETWITIAIARNVQIIDVAFNDQLMLPRRLFTCKTLVDLSIKNCKSIPASIGDVSLPSLKKLHLFYVKYEVDEALPHLLSGCPVLEKLFIGLIADQNLGCCNISSATIKTLSVNFPFCSSEFKNPHYRVKINAPALRYLNVHDCSYEHILFAPKTSLIEAYIRLNTLSNDVYARCVFKFLNRLCNVKCLKLFSCYESLDLAVAGSFVKFDNLTKLELTADCFFVKFLESAENLEVLIIREKLKNWTEPFQQVPKCLLSHLRTITIDQFGCTEHAFDMARYLLRNAKVLERMEIYSHHHETDLKAKSDALERISSFQQGSVACELVFH